MARHLTKAQAESPQGCASGTPKACFALTAGGIEGYDCLMQQNPAAACMAGIQTGWRVNIDPSDGKAWCPLLVLENSKSAS